MDIREFIETELEKTHDDDDASRIEFDKDIYDKIVRFVIASRQKALTDVLNFLKDSPDYKKKWDELKEFTNNISRDCPCGCGVIINHKEILKKMTEIEKK
jgi:hypothetical protein